MPGSKRKPLFDALLALRPSCFARAMASLRAGRLLPVAALGLLNAFMLLYCLHVQASSGSTQASQGLIVVGPKRAQYCWQQCCSSMQKFTQLPRSGTLQPHQVPTRLQCARRKVGDELYLGPTGQGPLTSWRAGECGRARGRVTDWYT